MNLVHIMQKFMRPQSRGSSGKYVTESLVVVEGCELLGEGSIGYRSYANNSLLRNITIGRFCSIGRRCSLGAARHSVTTFTTHPSCAPTEFVSDPATKIGNDVWIGDNVIVLAGVNIGDGAIIAGGAVVTKDVEPYSIVGGVPAKLLRNRFEQDIARKLIESAWWEFGETAVIVASEYSDPIDFVEALLKSNPVVMAPHFKPICR